MVYEEFFLFPSYRTEKHGSIPSVPSNFRHYGGQPHRGHYGETNTFTAPQLYKANASAGTRGRGARTGDHKSRVTYLRHRLLILEHLDENVHDAVGVRDDLLAHLDANNLFRQKAREFHGWLIRQA